MYRRVILSVVFILFGIAHQTFAMSMFYAWLDSLSGPGRFQGAVVDLKFLCSGTPTDLPVADRGASGDQALVAAEERAFIVDFDCRHLRQIKRVPDIPGNPAGPSHWAWDSRLMVGVETGWFKTGNTGEVQFADPLARNQTITLSTLGLSVDWARHPAFDIGATIGLAIFDGEYFGTATKIVVQPRLTLKPLALGSKVCEASQPACSVSRKRQALLIALTVPVYPGGFDAADFGGIPGSWSQKPDAQGLNLVVGVDVGALLYR